MRVSDVFLGLATGVPVMIVVGPIALMLVDQGLRKGVRRAIPAAIGVAFADLVYSGGAAVAGAAAARFLSPVEQWLEIGAVAALIGMAVHIGRQAWRDIQPLGRPGESLDATFGGLTAELASVGSAPVGSAPIGSGPVGSGSDSDADREVDHDGSHGASAVWFSTADRGTVTVAPPGDGGGQGDPRSGAAIGHLKLAGGFFGLTAINPITIVVFATIVMSGRQGVGSAGWVLGMVTASMLVNTMFVGIGHTLGAVVNDEAVNRLRLGGAALMALLAVLLVL